jgi:AcrR family transcriptional regulator
MVARRGHDAPRKTVSARETQIVDVAMRIIATKGARRFTAQLLATEIGVTAGAIFRHFESMEAIVDAVVERMGAILFEGFPPEAPDPIERLGLFFQHRTRTIRANPHVSRMLLSDHLSQAAGPAQAARLEEFKRRSRAFVVGCLREAEQDGTLSKEISPEAGAVIMLGSILSLAHATARITSGAGLERLADEVWAAIERTLRAPIMSGAPTEPSKRRQPRRAITTLDLPTRARISALVTEEIKTNRYDAASGNLTLTAYQAEAHASLVRYYTDLYEAA